MKLDYVNIQYIPFQGNWEGLPKRFRTKFSKISNAREQLSHPWRTFHFGENAETINAYVHRIRQVAAMLGYGEPLILEVFTNTLPHICIGYYSALRT